MSAPIVSTRRALFVLLVAFVVISSLQVEPVAEALHQDLMFIKGKFIKKDRRGVIVVDDKCSSCCHGKGYR